MTTLLIDGNSLMNRAFYGVRPLTTRDGINTNAVYGFLSMLHKQTVRFDTTRVLVAFDRKEKTYRHHLYEAYKAGRHAMPDELREQFPLIKDVLTSLGMPCLEKPGLEADDIIGILSRSLTKDGDTCVIVTGDRDSLQLITDRVTVCLASNKEDVLYDTAALYERYRLTPAQMIDLKALMGDSSDNIPGIPGVGEKTALSLLETYGSLDALYEHTDELKGALHDKVVNNKDSAYMSKRLGTIVTDADLSDILANAPTRDEEKARDIFTRLELTSLYAKFRLQAPEKQDAPTQSLDVSVRDADALPASDPLFIYPADGCFYAADKDGAVRVVDTPKTLASLSGRRVVTHDAKPLLRRLFAAGLEPFTLVFDTMLAGYLLDPSRSAYPLTDVYDALADTSLPRPASDAECATVLPALHTLAAAELEKRGQSALFNNIEVPLCTVLAEMEHIGFPADRDFLLSFGESLDETINDYRDEIHRAAGHAFNINSTKQLGTVLFEEMMMPVVRKTKTGYSTDNDVLEELRRRTESPVIDAVIEYRKLVKLRSTYVDGMVDKIDEGGRIHTIFTQTVTQTGRISSTEPNLQNIPVRTPQGRELRKAFAAREGCVLLDADYSQIELRVLADIADDKEMIRAFCENKDIHTITAAQVFGLPEEMVTPELRRRAKAVNFGIVYGIGEYSLSQDIDVSVREAKRYIAGYLQTYSGVHDYMDAIVREGRERGYVTTKFGRRRYVPDINAKQFHVRAFNERVCMNTPIQGTAADIIKLAMVGVHRRLKESGTGAKLIMQVHDELIIECPVACRDEVAAILKEEMENAVHLAVPLTVEVGSGKTWYDAKD